MNKRLNNTKSKHVHEGTFSPASIIGKFPPLTLNVNQVGLNHERSTEKMSSSTDTDSTIFLTDSAKIIKEKVNMYAVSGSRGNGSLEAHKMLGGDVAADIPCQYLKFFEMDDIKLHEIYEKFSKGEVSCSETIVN